MIIALAALAALGWTIAWLNWRARQDLTDALANANAEAGWLRNDRHALQQQYALLSDSHKTLEAHHAATVADFDAHLMAEAAKRMPAPFRESAEFQAGINSALALANPHALIENAQ